MTYEWAKPGVKVVCINDKPGVFSVVGHKYSSDNSLLVVKGEIYTIDSVNVHPDGSICIKPKGIKDRSCKDWGYNIERFKPLVSKDSKGPAERSSKKLPDTLTILLEKPQRVIIPDEFDFGKQWERV